MTALLGLDTQYTLPTPMPRQVRKAVLDKKNAPKESPGTAKWDVFLKDGAQSYEDVFIQAPEPVVDIADANIITSLLPWFVDGQKGSEQAHAPVLDLDFEHDYTLSDGVGVIDFDEEKGQGYWGSKIDLNNLINPLGVEVTKTAITIECPHLLIPSSTPGCAHLYLDVVMPHGKFFQVLEYLTVFDLIESGYYQASKHRGYSAVRCPWVKKSPKAVAEKQDYRQVLREISRCEHIEKELKKVLLLNGWGNFGQAANALGMNKIAEHGCYVGFENKHPHKGMFTPERVIGPQEFEKHLTVLKSQAPAKKGMASFGGNNLYNHQHVSFNGTYTTTPYSKTKLTEIQEALKKTEAEAAAAAEAIQAFNPGGFVESPLKGTHDPLEAYEKPQEVTGAAYWVEKGYTPPKGSQTSQKPPEAAEDPWAVVGHTPDGTDVAVKPIYEIKDPLGEYGGPMVSNKPYEAPLDTSSHPKYTIHGPAHGWGAKLVSVKLPLNQAALLFSPFEWSPHQHESQYVEFLMPNWSWTIVGKQYFLKPKPEKFSSPSPANPNVSPDGIYLNLTTGVVEFHVKPGQPHSWYRQPMGKVYHGAFWVWLPLDGKYQPTSHTFP